MGMFLPGGLAFGETVSDSHTITAIETSDVESTSQIVLETTPSGRANSTFFDKHYPISLKLGMGPQVSLNGYIIDGNVADIKQPVASDIEIFRSDNANVTGQRETIWRAYASSEAIEGSQAYKDDAGWHHLDQELVGNDVTGLTMADVLASSYITEGVDNVFLNGPQAEPTINNVERISLSSTTNRASDTPELVGVTLTERASDDTKTGGSSNDRVRAAAVLAVDADGNPTKWGELKDFTETSWTQFGDARTTLAMKKDATDNNYRPTDISGRGVPQQMGIMFISYADLGVEPGQAVYGISLVDPLQSNVNGDWQHTTPTVNEDNGTAWKNGVLDLSTLQWVKMEAPAPQTTEVSVTKSWSDDDDARGVRPESVTIHLLRDGEQVEDATAELNAQNDWTHTFEDLPVYQDASSDAKSVYTVEEDLIPGYATQVTGTAVGGFTITNTVIPDDTTSLQVNKVWVDDNNSAGTRPNAITVYLTCDGERVEGATAELNASNNWTHTFSDLPVHKQGSLTDEHVYAIEEVKVDGYTTEISTDAKTGVVTITNTLNKENPVDPGKKPDQKEPTPTDTSASTSSDAKVAKPSKVIPKTGDATATIGIAAAALAGAALVAGSYVARRHNRDDK
jgi:hypothetical protein